MQTGYFNDEQREYVIENMHPRRPLRNFLWNAQTIADIDQFAQGPTKACIEKQFRVICDARAVYIKDRETGEYFEALKNDGRLPLKKHFARVGQGTHTVKSEYFGIRSEFTMLIPQADYAEVQCIRVSNTDKRDRRLSVYTYVKPYVNLTGVDAYGSARFDKATNGIYFNYRGFRVAQKYTYVFYAASETPVAYDFTEGNFIGVYNGKANPIGVQREKLSEAQTTFEAYYAGVMQFDFVLRAEEERQIVLVCGTAKTAEEAERTAKKYAACEKFAEELRLQKEESESYIEKTLISTPDGYLNRMTNVWLKRQMSLGKTWGRVYGKGFRDVLQDIAGFVSLDTEVARERILNALKHQFISGNAIRMFDPILDYPYQDMPVWIAPTVLTYLKESGDFSILNEKIPYYDDALEESVFRHLQRGVEYSFSHLGKRGLCLWGGGDWNDSLDNCGMQMKGESVWLSIAAVKSANDFIELIKNSAKAIGLENAEKSISDLSQKTKRLKEAVLAHGTENGRFIYGYNDWDEKVGSETCAEGKIFLNVQTWAVLADIVGDEGKKQLLDIVEDRLKCDYGYLQNDPPYTIPNDHLGRLTYFAPGVYENGSVYNHGVMFKVVADCIAGKGDAAWKTLKAIRFDNPANADSGVEPYAICNMYFGPSAAKERIGYAPQAWITGSAGWMYRAATEYLLGVRAEFDGLKIKPCLPTSWQSAEVIRKYRGSTYRIRFTRGLKNSLTMDGKEYMEILPYVGAGKIHEVYCEICND